jgi:hypothetical protein
MFRQPVTEGEFDLAKKAPLEMVARFLAAQAWSREILQPTPQSATGPEDSRYAVEVADYMEQHWREYLGPAALLTRTCYKRPTRMILHRICAKTGAPENLVLTIWDAALEVTSDDRTVTSAAQSPEGSPSFESS